jgi:hypothetical protein
LLAGAPQYGLIGRLRDQGMFESVRRLRRQPLLVQELRLYQLVEPLSQGLLVPGVDGLQQGIGKLAPQGRPYWMAMCSRIVRRACRVFCFGCSGDKAREA